MMNKGTLALDALVTEQEYGYIRAIPFICCQEIVAEAE
jgi:hypothetical protein